MRKPKSRKERVAFLLQKKGKGFKELLACMTDREVKQFFDSIYPQIKDLPDAATDDEVQCIRCKCNVTHHFECLCGWDRAVFDEFSWRMDIEDGDLSELPELDKEFMANGYKIKD